MTTAAPISAPTRSSRSLPAQDRVVLGVALALALVCAVALDGFATTDNLLLLLRSVAVLGVLSAGLALVIISSGLDLSVVATATISTAAALLVSESHGVLVGLLAGLALAVGVGVVNAVLITLFEVPAFFATLGVGIAGYGIVRSTWAPDDTIYIPESAGVVQTLGGGRLLGLPVAVLVLVAVLLLLQAYLTRTSYGRFSYAHGDNAQAARLTGIATRKLILQTYVISALVAFVAGLLLAGGARQLDMQVASSSLVYNVLLVVVVGGVSLTGGRGSMLGVVAGTLLLGVLINGMTLLNLETSAQNIVTGAVLLAALVLDNRLHPRDEETARQGE